MICLRLTVPSLRYLRFEENFCLLAFRTRLRQQAVSTEFEESIASNIETS